MHKTLLSFVTLLVASLLLETAGLATPSWDYTTSSVIYAHPGDQIMLVAMPRLADLSDPDVDWFGGKARIKYDGKEYIFTRSNEASCWKAGMLAYPACVLTDVATGESRFYSTAGNLDGEIFLWAIETDPVTKYITGTGAPFILSIKPLAKPTAYNQPYAVKVTDVVKAVTYDGQVENLRVSGSGTDNYTDKSSFGWTKDGQPYSYELNTAISYNPTSVLVIPSFDGAKDAGTYVATFTDLQTHETITHTTKVIDMATAQPSQIVNLSIRANARTGSGTLIAGFVVDGTGEKELLIRGVGPGLDPAIQNPIQDPHLALNDILAHTVIKENEDWDPALKDTFAELGAQPFPDGSKDAAILINLKKGVYTAHISTSNDGVGMAELYDSSMDTSSRLVNISGRAPVTIGEGSLIAGFVIKGSKDNTPMRVLIRGVGPGLLTQGVTDYLADPKLTLHQYGVDRPIDQNDDWGGTPAMVAVAKQVGAFDLAANSKDAVILTDLAPGIYTAVVSGAGASSGVALVEVYEVKDLPR